MGRPVKKKWFTAYEGSVAGNLTLAVGTLGTPEPVIKQVGTGVYDVASGRVKLSDPNAAGYVATDPAPGIVGTATLTHDGRDVRRINQYRVTYFDDADGGTAEDAVWRDGDANIVGVFVPALTAEGDEPGIAAVAEPTPPPAEPEPETPVEVSSVEDEPKPSRSRSRSKKKD